MAESERILADYRIVSRLGRGGMGTVYKGVNIHNGTLAAIKILPAEMAKNEKFVNKFLREAHAATVLNHKNIVRIYEAGEFCGLYYIALEYIDGETLANALEREGKIPLKIALRITAQVAQGLQHAHERGIVHRDIKPGNIMIARDGNAKITDMGLARLSYMHDSPRQGFTVGTPAYMSPEQVMTPDKMDARSDIYSLGATLYHMLFGRPPHLGRTAEEVMTKVVKEDEHYPASTPKGVVAFLRKMLDKNPNRRFNDAGMVSKVVLKLIESPESLPTDEETEIIFDKKKPSRTHFQKKIIKINKRNPAFKEEIVHPKRGKSRLLIIFLAFLALSVFTAEINADDKASDKSSAEIKELVHNLCSDFYTDRQHALMALIEKGIASEDAMLEVLKTSDNENAQIAAIEVLSRIGSKKALSVLIEILEKSNIVTLRKAAMEGLSRYEPDSFSSLIENYENLDKTLKRFVITLVKKMLIEHTRKQFYGQTWIIYPGQFDKFKKIRKAVGEAIRNILEEWVSLADENWGRPEMSILIMAAGDLKLEETKEVLRKIADRELSGIGTDDAVIALALMGEREGFDSLVKEYKRMLSEPIEKANAYAMLAHLYHQVRDYKTAEEYYKKAIDTDSNGSLRANYACLLSVSGRPKEALEELDKALKAGLSTKEWLLYDGELENMRKLPEFKELAEKYNLLEKEEQEDKKEHQEKK
jgi:tetratricopeptide (TPR) repeat protein